MLNISGKLLDQGAWWPLQTKFDLRAFASSSSIKDKDEEILYIGSEAQLLKTNVEDDGDCADDRLLW